MKVVCFSGGKDSSAMLLRMIELNYEIDEIVFADTLMEFPEMYEYINKVEKMIKRPIKRLKPIHNWNEWFYGLFSRGKYKGNIRGFPYVVNRCWYNREAKAKPLDNYNKKAKVVYIGIASDEKNRIEREMYKDKSKWKFPLIEWGWSELDCYEYLQKRNMLNPLYKKFKRTGCWVCPKQNLESLQILFQDYPELWENLKKYEQDSPHGFKPNIRLKDFETRFKGKPKINNDERNQTTLIKEDKDVK